MPESEPEENVLLQGVIDCLIETEDGFRAGFCFSAGATARQGHADVRRIWRLPVLNDGIPSGTFAATCRPLWRTAR